MSLSTILSAIAHLRQCCQVNLHTGWRSHLGDLPLDLALDSRLWQNWQSVSLNPKNHIAWPAGQQVFWLGQVWYIPSDLNGYPLAGLNLRVALTWWADLAEIFINGQLIQTGDLFDCSTRILVASPALPGEKIEIALKLISPGHDNGALVKSGCLFETVEGLDPGFFADELEVIKNYAESFDRSQLEVLKTAAATILELPLEKREELILNLEQFRQQLQSQISLPAVTIALLGHAHLDLAWLWPVSETWKAAQQTFESVLKLQQDFPELIFCHSTPALYEWIEEHRPDLFAAIQQHIKAGTWEIVAGFWVEPELNLINGESIVRQVLYGQRYCWEKFGSVNAIAWVPDSFGFCWQLPQILVKGGVQYFVTQKLRWNDTTSFPYEIFWWQSPDGTKILSYMSALIGESIDPVKMSRYAFEFHAKTGLPEALWLPGVGDHGGGPTRDMLELARKWSEYPTIPKFNFKTASTYLSTIAVETDSNLPVWNDELYLEFHRGCYTTHADQKRYNRRCEQLLYQAELWASLATLSVHSAYPKTELQQAWKKVLFNQFHDILPGSSIPPVYEDANRQWQAAERVCQEIIIASIQAIALNTSLPTPPHPQAKPLLIFNSLNWTRTEVVTINLPSKDTPWAIYDIAGNNLPVQQINRDLIFLATDIPSVGYRLFWLVPTFANLVPNLQSEFPILENQYLRIKLNPNTGDLSSLFDKIGQRELLNSVGNQLQAFQDSGQYWDAWNIDPNYTQHPLPPTQLKSLEWITPGEIEQRLRVVRQLGQSEFTQDYILQTDSPLLKIHTTVHWQEKHTLVKTAFPLNLEADFATYEIPCGAIERTTKPQTPQEQAKWEVYGIHWADLTHTDKSFGISLLNDCKYGYDAQPNQLRLTLLRSPNWPNPQADQGYHEFTYAVYPHAGTWEQAETVRRGYELNSPLQTLILSDSPASQSANLPAVRSFLDLPAENLVLMALKQSEDNPQQWILRCYESYGKPAEFSLKSDLDLTVDYPVNLLEQPSQEFVKESSFTLQPWEIASFAIKRTSR